MTSMTTLTQAHHHAADWRHWTTGPDGETEAEERARLRVWGADIMNDDNGYPNILRADEYAAYGAAIAKYGGNP